MVDFYSATLGMAVLAAVAALALALMRRHATRRFAGPMGVIALVLVAISGLSHAITGHAPGSSSALGPAAFAAEHPALWVTAGVAVLALACSRFGRNSA